MKKDLFTWFEEKLQKHINNSNSNNEAFDKTIQDIGFEPYNSYNSFAAVRSKKYKKRKPKK